MITPKTIRLRNHIMKRVQLLSFRKDDMYPRAPAKVNRLLF